VNSLYRHDEVRYLDRIEKADLPAFIKERKQALAEMRAHWNSVRGGKKGTAAADESAQLQSLMESKTQELAQAEGVVAGKESAKLGALLRGYPGMPAKAAVVVEIRTPIDPTGVRLYKVPTWDAIRAEDLIKILRQPIRY
jgi:hypothetical protein